ncbi:hypothetical protein ACQ4PT_030347 [Festuca glaucescens]
MGKEKGLEGPSGTAELPGSQSTSMDVDVAKSSGAVNHGKSVAVLELVPKTNLVAITPYNPSPRTPRGMEIVERIRRISPELVRAIPLVPSTYAVQESYANDAPATVPGSRPHALELAKSALCTSSVCETAHGADSVPFPASEVTRQIPAAGLISTRKEPRLVSTAGLQPVLEGARHGPAAGLASEQDEQRLAARLSSVPEDARQGTTAGLSSSPTLQGAGLGLGEVASSPGTPLVAESEVVRPSSVKEAEATASTPTAASCAVLQTVAAVTGSVATSPRPTLAVPASTPLQEDAGSVSPRTPPPTGPAFANGVTPIQRSGRITMHGSFPSWKAWNAGRASDFIWSEAQTLQELLVSFMGVSFEDPESLPIKNHELTTEEHGKDLRAFDLAKQDMEYGIGDGGEEETQTHEGSNEEMDLDEEQHRYEGMLDEAHEGFMIKNDEVKRQRKHVNPINPYANADLLEDFTATARCSSAVRRLMDSKGVTAFDIVLHDGDRKNKKRKRGGEEATRQSALIIDVRVYLFLFQRGTFH